MARWLTTDEVERAKAMYAEGMSTAAIGAVLGVSGSCIGTRLRRAGVKIRPRGKVPAEPVGYEGDWYRDGLILRPTAPAR